MCVCVHVCVLVHVCVCMCARAKQVGMCVGLVVCYGVALVSRIDKIIGLFCKRALSKRRYSAKETYNFIATDRSHPIGCVSNMMREEWHDIAFLCVCVVRVRVRVRMCICCVCLCVWYQGVMQRRQVLEQRGVEKKKVVCVCA